MPEDEVDEAGVSDLISWLGPILLRDVVVRLVLRMKRVERGLGVLLAHFDVEAVVLGLVNAFARRLSLLRRFIDLWAARQPFDGVLDPEDVADVERMQGGAFVEEGLPVVEPVPQADLVPLEAHRSVEERHVGPALVLRRHDVEVVLIVSHLRRDIKPIPLKNVLLIDLQILRLR